MSVQPPRGAGRVRLLKIPGIDLQPCGGTHVANIAEIGAHQGAAASAARASTTSASRSPSAVAADLQPVADRQQHRAHLGGGAHPLAVGAARAPARYRDAACCPRRRWRPARASDAAARTPARTDPSTGRSARSQTARASAAQWRAHRRCETPRIRQARRGSAARVAYSVLGACSSSEVTLPPTARAPSASQCVEYPYELPTSRMRLAPPLADQQVEQHAGGAPTGSSNSSRRRVELRPLRVRQQLVLALRRAPRIPR